MKAENSTRIQFDSLSSNEAYARGVTAAFLARYDPTVPQLADLKTAVSEAVTNCIVHAYPERIGPVCMTIAVYPDRRCTSPLQIRALASPMWSRPCSHCSPPATRKSAPVWALR